MDYMSFGEALERLREGCKVTSKGWGHAYISLYEPSDIDIVDMPYIYMTLESGATTIWMPTHTELLSFDWFVYDDVDLSY